MKQLKTWLAFKEIKSNSVDLCLPKAAIIKTFYITNWSHDVIYMKGVNENSQVPIETLKQVLPALTIPPVYIGY